MREVLRGCDYCPGPAMSATHACVLLACLLHAPLHQLSQLAPAGCIVGEELSRVDLIFLLTLFLVVLHKWSSQHITIVVRCSASLQHVP